MASRGTITSAVIAAVATVAAAVLTVVLPKVLADEPAGPAPGPGTGPTVVLPTGFPGLPDLGEVQLFANKESAPVGATVLVGGRGFLPDEAVEIRFHVDVVATTRAGQGGDFANVSIKVPTSLKPFAGSQFEIIATGKKSIRHATVPITVSG